MENIYLIVAAAACAVLMYMLLQKMKHSNNKDDSVWVASFIVVSGLLAYCLTAVIFMLFAMMAVIQTITFGLFAGLMLFAVGVSAPIVYYFTEHIKYAEKYEKLAKKLEHPILESGFTYVVEEPKNEKSMKLFSEMVAKGATGLCITRNNPKELKEQHKDFDKLKIFWLTEMAGEGNLKPTDLEELSYHITNFVNSAQNPVIYLEGFEYLINYNNFTKILHLFQVLKDTITVKKAIMIMPINPETFEKPSLKMVELEFKVI